jgi:hypothetical protein
MNFITHFNRFYVRLSREPHFTSRHISLYLALFHCWNYHRFENPFPLIRERVMLLSGLRSKDSYMRCLKELHLSGYIIYSPALHKYHRPKVSILSLMPPNGIEPQLPLFAQNDDNSPDPGPQNRPGTGTAPVPDSCSQINSPVPNSGHINKTIINNINRERETHAPNSLFQNHQEYQTAPPRAAPFLDEVLAHFKQAGFPANQAPLFFNHYEAIGWKLGGKTPITNWHAAAAKWMDYAKNFNHQPNEKPGNSRGTDHLHVQPNKDYKEPL